MPPEFFFRNFGAPSILGACLMIARTDRQVSRSLSVEWRDLPTRI